MFTNQKVLGIILILFILGATGYFFMSKFKKDTVISSSPTPTPASLDFNFNLQPAQNQQTQQPQTRELPLAKNKRLDEFPGILKPEILQNKKAVLQTKKGIIQLQIYPEASMAASNFILLAANGFYDGLIFHRVEDWVVQGGDPMGTGGGGPGYQFPDEPVRRDYTKGTVAMANSGPNTNGSQFFILKTDYPLEPKYTIFGMVLTGMDVIEKITVGDMMQKVVIQELK